MVVFAIGFNFWLYRLEPTSMVDPNDNAFQFGLVDRTNQIWDWAQATCPKNLTFPFCHFSFLIDHWVPNWAQGYNLPFYYSHVPQILIVGSYRFLHWSIGLLDTLRIELSAPSLFQYYHIIIYLLLSFFPLSVFVALRVIGLPWIGAGIGALISSHLSTDGLYGLDPPSFIWRGWGLSSQLFAMPFMPLAIAYSWRYFTSHAFFWLAVFFITATTAGHLGMGIIVFLSLPVMALSDTIFLFFHRRPVREIMRSGWNGIKYTALIAAPAVFLLSYWIIPAFLQNNYHNISVWDPVWKFNSFGVKEVVIKFINGDLFDYGRFPIYSGLVFIGFFTVLWQKSLSHGYIASLKKNNMTMQQCDNKLETSNGKEKHPYFPFGILFIFFLLLFFGRTTWGSLIDLIPGMKEYHLHRFIIGLHLIGLFLAPIGFLWLVDSAMAGIQHFLKRYLQQCNNRTIQQLLHYSLIALLLIAVVPRLYSRTIEYAAYNDTLIKQANVNYDQAMPDMDKLFSILRGKPSGRIYAGRGGWWGKDLRIAETAYTLYLSTFGFNTVLWLPETWSPNSDTEQYFVESNPSHYDLYNIRWVVALPSVKPEKFWKPVYETPSWKLYEVDTQGYITEGVAPSVVLSDKQSFTNAVRLWIQSPYSANKLFPRLVVTGKPSPFTKDPHIASLPHFAMLDEAAYQTPDGKQYSLFQNVPVYVADTPNMKILSEDNDADMTFAANAEVKTPCKSCVVVLKQTFHPNWRAWVNGKAVRPFSVFPFFTAVSLEQEGTYNVIFAYRPSVLKIVLLWFEGLAFISLVIFYFYHRRYKR